MTKIFRLFLLNFFRRTDSGAENKYSQIPRRTGALTDGATKKGGSVEMHVVLDIEAYVYLNVLIIFQLSTTEHTPVKTTINRRVVHKCDNISKRAKTYSSMHSTGFFSLSSMAWRLMMNLYFFLRLRLESREQGLIAFFDLTAEILSAIEEFWPEQSTLWSIKIKNDWSLHLAN